MSTYEELLTDLETKLEEVWDAYDKVTKQDLAARGSYLLGKIRGIEYAIALLQAELRST